MKILGVMLSALMLLSGATLAQNLPPLNFDAPAGFAGGGAEVATFIAPENDLVIHVYPFRRLGPGDFQARFRETLLREFVVPELREAKVTAAPRIEPFGVEGAESALMAKFTEDRSGVQRERSRLAMLAAGAVAIVDVTATNAAAAERHAAAVKEMLESLSVGQPKARAAPPPVLSTPGLATAAAAPAPAPQAAAPAPLPPFAAGLYVGNVRRLVPNFVGGKEAGGIWVTGPQYFLFYSGYVYSNYEAPRVPGGDPGRFDWERVRREDPANAGTYELVGGELTLRLGTETISARLAGPGRFEIFGNYFKRTAAK